MKRIVLLLLVVLWMESTASADYIPVIREVENGCPGLCTYVVGLTVDDQGGIDSLTNLDIQGGVHQLTLLGEDTPREGPVLLSTVGDLALLDTHDLFDTMSSLCGTGLGWAGLGYMETHDGSDPYSIVSLHSRITAAGIGDYKVASDPTTVALCNPIDNLYSIEFMQIVVPQGGEATLTGLYTNTWATSRRIPMVPFSITVVGVPEPSTLVLLVLSGLCFLGTRRL